MEGKLISEKLWYIFINAAFIIAAFGVCARLVIYVLRDIRTAFLGDDEENDTDETGRRQKQGQ